jgi:hypothetical protein
MSHMAVLRACLLVSVLLTGACPAYAQGFPNGYVSLFADYFPNKDDTAELRARVFVEETFDPTPKVLINASAFAEGLLARRPSADAERRLGTVRDATVRVHDLNVLYSTERFDVLAGYARVTWGKLDEIQPTDVINPLDVSRFFFEGRSEARLPMLLARGRLHVTDAVTIEGVYLPDFRRGRFDQLDEPTSPFNLPSTVAQDPVVCLAIGCPMIPAAVSDREPVFTPSNAQGGARASVTTGRVDWSVSAFRGFESFGLYAAERVPLDPAVPLSSLALVYPRFTMIGGDFEAVRGEWGLRGELAAFVADNFQSPELRVVTGTSVDAGVGVDRRAGSYTLSATVLFHGESYDLPLAAADPADGRSDVSFVASADRTFARERYRLRGFGVYNATEASGFLRGIGIASLKDNLALEGSLGWFLGDGRDLVGRFGDSDFAYLRLRYYF